MGIRELAKQDIEDITTNLDEFGLTMTFATPNGEIELEVIGTEAKVHLNFDFETGKNVNAQKAHVSVSEQLFIDANYPVRNAKGSVSMKNHKVDYIDSTGTLCKFQVMEQFPDETLGIIVFALIERKI